MKLDVVLIFCIVFLIILNLETRTKLTKNKVYIITNKVKCIKFQTIRCLLIHPNPESALNEEAGRMLQEDYSRYSTRARLMTEIHATPSPLQQGQQKFFYYNSNKINL